MLSLVLLDGTALHNQQLSIHLKNIIAEEDLDAEVVLATTEARAVLDFARGNRERAVYFLDVELGVGCTGIEVCKSIRELDANAYVVYVSVHRQYAMACLKSHAFDFVDTAVMYEELRECLLAVVAEMGRRERGNSLLIEMGSRMVFVDQRQITHFTIEGARISVHREEELLPYAYRGSFAELMSKLTVGMFFQIRRDVIVNIRYIEDVDWKGNTVVLRTGEVLKVARRNRRGLYELLFSGVKM